MSTTRVRSPYGLAVIAFLTVACLPSPVGAADDDAALRKRVLQLNDVTGSDPIDGQIKALGEDAAGTKKLLAVAVLMAKEKEQPLNYNAAFILARAAQELKNLPAAETFYRICTDQAVQLQSGQKLIQSFGGLIDLYYENKRFDQTAKICREFIELRGDPTVERLKPAVMERMIQALARQGKTDEALKLVNNLVEAEQEDSGWWYLQLKAWVQREAGKFEDSVKSYETVLDRIRKDKALKEAQKTRFVERYRYLLSGVFVDMKQIDKAAEHLNALLEQKPNDPTYNNDLGFIWADHDMHLDKAEKLILKALEEDRKQRKSDPELKPEDDRDNAAYLDSLGWVYFKQKKYAEAKKQLLLAVQDKDGQHLEIYDHLGDVHMVLGDKAAAIAAWKKGLTLEIVGRRDLERKAQVEKKLKANQ